MNNLQLFHLKNVFSDSKIQKFLRTEEPNLFVCKENVIYNINLDKNDCKQLSVTSKLPLIGDFKNLHHSVLSYSDFHSIYFYNYSSNECVSHSFDFQYQSVSWSPSQNLLCLVDKDGSIQTHRFEDCTYITKHGEGSIYDNDPLYAQINVGWGSKDTQFKGSARKKVEVADENNQSDKSPPTIAWDVEGKNFVINFYSDSKQHRVFKVFSEKCKLLNIGETEKGLQSVCSWKPKSIYLGIPIESKGCMYVGIFEKNGQIKEKFLLLNNFPVTQIEWTTDGLILATLQKSDSRSPLSLYYHKNGTWFLKQYLDFSLANVAINFQFLGSLEQSIYHFSVLTTNGIFDYSFKLCFNKYHWKSANITTSIVINGCFVQIYYLNRSLIPLEDETDSITLESPINSFAFHPTKPKLLLTDCRNQLYIYNLDECKCEIISKHNLPVNYGLPFNYGHFFWKTESTLACIEENNKVIDVFKNEIIDEKFCGNITQIGYNSDNDDFIVIEQRFNNVQIKNNNSLIFEINLEKIPINLEIFNLVIFNLSVTKELFANNELLCENVTSFNIHDNFLHLTTTSDKLLTLKLHKNATIEMIQQCFFEKKMFRQSIETGSVLIAGISNTASLIFELPRGNFETKMHRTILIMAVEKMLNEGKWQEAYDVIRINKLNSNILIDLDVDRFLNSLPNFISAVKSCNIINQIVMALESQNIFYTVYKNCLDHDPKQIENKITIVCESIIDCLQKSVDYTNYLPCIATCCTVMDLRNANDLTFQFISDVFTNDADQSVKHATNKTVKILIANSSENDVFKSALKTYNLNLAEYVAQAAKIDPKEYEVFFENLKNTDDLHMRYLINDYLENWDFALLYLLRIPENERNKIDYVKFHNLHSTALEYLKPTDVLWKSVNEDFAKQLMSKAMFESAGVVYCGIGSYDHALDAFKRARKWQKALAILPKLNLSNELLIKMKLSFAESLTEDGLYKEAAIIYNEHLKEHEKAIRVLTKACLFTDAITIANNWEEECLIDSLILPTAEQHVDNLQNLIESNAELFKKYYHRLKKIREDKLNSLKSITESSGIYYENYLDKEDLYSEMGSTISVSSRSSASRRKKEQRKKISIKEGSVYENIGLIRALHQLIAQIFKLGEEVKQLCLLLVTSKYLKCKKIHNDLFNLQNGILKSIHTIWPAGMESVNFDRTNLELVASRFNIDELDVEFRKPPVNLHVDWTLPFFV